MGYREEVLADNPLIYFGMGESSGTFANEGSLGGSASRNNLTSTTGIVGRGDGAATFGSAPSYAALADVSASNWDGAFTIELWFKSITQNDKTLIWFKNQPYWYLNTNGQGRLSFTADDSKAATITITTTASVLGNNTWQHAVAVVDSGTVRLYLNGTQVASKAGSPNLHSVLGAVEVGDSRTAFSPTAGAVDEVAVYPTALSAARILAHYNAGITPPPPVSLDSGLAGELLIEGLAGATVELFSPSFSIEAGVAGSLDLHSLFGPVVELGPMPPKELLTGLRGNVSLLGTNGPKLAKASYAGQAEVLELFGLGIDKPHISNISTKVVYAGEINGLLRLFGTNGATLTKTAPQILGVWYMQTIMADAKFDVRRDSQNVEARLPRKRIKTHLANLVKN